MTLDRDVCYECGRRESWFAALKRKLWPPKPMRLASTTDSIFSAWVTEALYEERPYNVIKPFLGGEGDSRTRTFRFGNPRDRILAAVPRFKP